MLRSLRHAPDELILQGTITPAKKQSPIDIDRLCDIFNSKVKVSPKRNKSKAKVDLIPKHQTVYNVDDKAVLKLHVNFEDAKMPETEQVSPRVNVRPRRMIKEDSSGAKKIETLPRRSNRVN